MSFRATPKLLSDWLTTERAESEDESKRHECPACGLELDFRLGRNTGLYRFTHLGRPSCQFNLECLAWGETRAGAEEQLAAFHANYRRVNDEA